MPYAELAQQRFEVTIDELFVVIGDYGVCQPVSTYDFFSTKLLNLLG